MPALKKMSLSDKQAIVMLADAHRKDGHKDFVARTCRELSVSNYAVKYLLKQYRDGELNMTSEVCTQFSTEEWAQSKTAIAKKAMEIVDGTLENLRLANETDDSRKVRDYSQAFSNLWRPIQSMVEGTQAASSGPQTNVQIVLPPKDSGREEIEIVESS